jgi:exosortase E/protease (VPEID-CTERM system)
MEWALVSGAFQLNLGGHRLAWFVVPFCSTSLAVGFTRRRSLAAQLKGLASGSLGWTALGAHLVAFFAFVALCFALRPGGPRSAFLVVLLYLSAFVSIGTAAAVFLPARPTIALARAMGRGWIVASLGAALIGGLAVGLVSFWNTTGANPLEIATFRSVEACVGLFVNGVSVVPSRMRIATPNFRVRMRGGCSGIEGLGLMLAFSSAWLWLCRREVRFPRALLLVPFALVAVWAANVARITALILIGHAGARDVALGGFHSQAGWIFFNGIALGFAAVAGRLRWFSREPAALAGDQAGEQPTAAYLVPFLAILAASLVSRAASAGFEWLYPLRFLAAAAALWHFRSTYRSMDWRFGWTAVGAGVAVFLAWVGLASWLGPSGNGAIDAELAHSPNLARLGWVLVRAAAAITTVPIAEELAFRGYLCRRLVAADFESVAFRTLAVVPIATSSVLFGVMHGGQWLAGTLAGLVYALVLRRGGRIGDAVAAHATTNGLLAVWVITRGDWWLW